MAALERLRARQQIPSNPLPLSCPLQKASEVADICSALLAVQHAPRNQTLQIVSSKNTSRVAMTCNLGKLEDRGWVGIADREPLKSLAAELRSRTAPTVFVEVSPESSSAMREGMRTAALQARDGLQTREQTKIALKIESSMALDGIKLSTLTQRLAYAGIKELKAEVTRKATANDVKQIQAAIKLQSDKLPTTPQVWASIRYKDFTRQVRNFLWKSLHSASGNVPILNEPEDLEHIVLKCKHPGQQEVWALAKGLWLKKHSSWPLLSLGSILGCSLTEFTDDRGRPLLGESRLYHILISESLFMIWKIRNNCVINRAGSEMLKHEIHNKWLYAINLRLKFDRALTNHAKFGKQNSIKISLVLQTWWSTLMEEDKLPENWIREPRVLVGTEQHWAIGRI
ncbi:hypothetical protein C8F04DRAFT_1223174 [Mycena alexandri]|uniref:Uncharacterized protein n=1 Tax=Mycena alexandri TaxID=1745969 RepID=A0AAD6SDQ9_9AGAR|nr:hypothetical protein C8F04DRAFT_1223174 [Mycena alexandri]